MVGDRVYNVLFLCTHNSARSVMAECILNRKGKGRFRALRRQPAVGTHQSLRARPAGPAGLPDGRAALQDLGRVRRARRTPYGFRVHRVRQRRGRGLSGLVRPADDRPLGFPDPSTAEGSYAQKAAFTAGVFRQIQCRIQAFASLSIASLDRFALKSRLDELGRDTAPQALA